MLKYMRKILCVALVALLLAAAFVGCDRGGELSFTVKVTTVSLKPISGVTVTVTKDGQSVASGRTGEDGAFSFKAKPGKYTVTLTEVPSRYEVSGNGSYDFDASEQNDTLTLRFVDSDAYNFTVNSVGGAKLEGVSVKLLSGETEVASAVTDESGIASMDVQEGDYTYVVSDLPNGYYTTEEAPDRGQTGTNKKLTLSFPSRVTDSPRTDRLYREGDIFFDFEIYDVLTGTAYRLSEILAEKSMTLINFWNTNCGPCVSEMPGLSIAYAQYSGSAQVLAISTFLFSWDTARDVTQFAQGFTGENALSFPLFADGAGVDDIQFRKYFNLSSLPTNVVIDRYGMVAAIDSRGASGTDVFLRMFEKYTAQDYVQDTFGDDGETEGGADAPVRLKPTKTQADSASIEAAINGEGFDGEWYPESGTADAEYSWPWEIQEIVDAGVPTKVLAPTNHFVDYSFATIKTKVTVSPEDISDGGRVALVFDLKYSTELWNDYFYVIVNNTEVYSYTGTEHWATWQRCYALVATEPGEYELTLLYNKDDLNGEGQDTVYIKNVRMITASQVNGETGSLDMPRDAVVNWDGKTGAFAKYAPAVLNSEDGYYHYENENGPYLLANLFARMPFQLERGYERNISEATMAGVFKDEQGRDMEADITPYLIAANNSELPGLTVVTEELKDMLNSFAKAIYPDKCGDNAWLEFCIWFEHFGTDPADKGISTFDRNPVRGLMKRTAIPMKQPHNGMFDDLTNIENGYKNNVTIDRMIMPRGLMYSITPDRSGAYRFRSQSAPLNDTTAWLRDETMGFEQVITEVGEEREDPTADYNFILTWYLEEGKTYYLSVAHADVGGTGEFTFTTEYLGPEFYSWQAVSRAIITFEEGENGEMGSLKNYYNAYPVLAGDGYYYDALRNADGTPILDAKGNMTPDLNDPIYVDFLNGTRFISQSIESVIEMGETSNVLKRLRESILPRVFNYTGSIVASTSLTQLNAGNPMDDEMWMRLASEITSSYGDTVTLADDPAMMEELKKCVSVISIVNLLTKYYLNAFDYSGWQGMYWDEQTPMWKFLGLNSDDELKNYTSDMKNYLEEAKAKTTADHSDDLYGRYGFDKGCVRLDDKLRTILMLFTERYDWLELHTNWMRLCYHYEYLGPYQG